MSASSLKERIEAARAGKLASAPSKLSVVAKPAEEQLDLVGDLGPKPTPEPVAPASLRKRKLAISVFASTTDLGEIESQASTWNDLTKSLAERPPEAFLKKELRLLQLARFGNKRNPHGKGSYRWHGNVVYLSGIVADYDGEQVSVDDAAKRLEAAGIASFVYSSPSHTPDKPRWRVLAPLSVDTAPSEHGKLVDKLNGALGGVLAPESWVLTQPMYFGRLTNGVYETRRITGRALDVVEGITPIGKRGGALHERRVARTVVELQPSAEIDELRKLIAGKDAGCSYVDWIHTGMALHFETGGSDIGLALWDEWSQGGDNYAGIEDLEPHWNSFNSNTANPVTAGSLRRAQVASDDDFGPPLPPDSNARPRIALVPGRFDDYAEACEKVLGRDLYTRDHAIVRIGSAPDLEDTTTHRANEQPVILKATPEFLKRRLTKLVTFVKWDVRSKEWVDRDCPSELALNIAKQGEWRAMRPLRTIASAPFLRADLTVCDVPGYDALSRVLYVPNAEFLKVPEQPTQRDGAAALATLLAPFDQFPFADDSHRAAFAAHLLAEAARLAIDTSPIFAYTAPEAGSGKSLLAEMPASIVHGVTPAMRAWAADGDELRKVLFASLLVGDRTIGFDNIPSGAKVYAAELCRFVTSITYSDRKLGVSETASLPNTSVVFVTGNNITPAGDLARRSIVVRLDANMDSQSLRERRFTIGDLRGYVAAHRAELLMAALTVIRAFVVAGKPAQSIPLPSFEQWSRLARDPLIWLGLPDPVITQDTETENESEPLGAVFDAIAAWRGDAWFAANELHAQAAKEVFGGPIRDALIAATCDATDPRRVGMWLNGHKGRVVRGIKLAAGKTTGNSRQWRLVGAPTLTATAALMLANPDTFIDPDSDLL